MKYQTLSFFKWAFLASLFSSTAVIAQPPQTLNYQGKVSVDDEPFNGTGYFKFALVDDGTENVSTATASANIDQGLVTSLTLVESGSGYTSPPTVTIDGGGGSGAEFEATLENGQVTGFTRINPGDGYTSEPDVLIDSPPSASIQTVWSNDGSSSGGDEPSGAVELSVSEGIFSVALGDLALDGMSEALSPETFVEGPLFLRVWYDDGSGTFEQLSPDQPLASVPHALIAEVAESSNEAKSVVTHEPNGFSLNPTSAGGLIVETGGETFMEIGTPGVYDETDSSASIVMGYKDNTLQENPDEDMPLGATVSGGGADGSPNIVKDHFGTVGGGRGNTASGMESTVGGGLLNEASGRRSTIGGGVGNIASELVTTVAGGERNEATDINSTVGGGSQNEASGVDSTIAGGRNNKTQFNNSTVGGGISNTASGAQSTVGGGTGNEASGVDSTIGGGRDNEASGGRSIIGGGNSNTASASLSTIGGGTGNETSELYSTVAGGFGNTASGDRSTVAGGSINEASGSRSTVAGGLSNEAAGDFSFAAGKQSKVGEDHHGTFVWADHTQEDFESTDEDQFLIRAGGGVGIGTNAPNNQLSVDGKANFSDHVGIGRTSPETNLHLAGLNAESNNPDGLRMQDSRIREGNFWDLHLGDSSLRFGKNGDDVAYVDSTGDWNIFSDARLKTDITPVESVLSEVENLKVVNYHYKDRDHGEHPQVGFLAQDVDKLFPHLTSRENNNDYWSLNYTGFSVLAIRAIQEQQEIIETQDARLAKQEDRITELEEQLAAQDDLEARLARLENTVAGEELAASRE